MYFKIEFLNFFFSICFSQFIALSLFLALSFNLLCVQRVKIIKIKILKNNEKEKLKKK